MTTDIDKAHAEMEARPDDDAARLQFFERVADSELFLLLSGDPVGDAITPEIFDIQDAKFALVFDREERLATFVGRAAPYAGVPGRGLVHMLENQGIGLALNLEVAPSAMLIPATAVDWLAETLRHAPVESEARLKELLSPGALPEDIVKGLDRKLAIAAGMASRAYLAQAIYDDDTRGHVLVFVDAKEGAEKPLAHAAGEALTFSGIDAGIMDVMYANTGDAIVAHLDRLALRFDLPEPETPALPAAPGMDPQKPPKLI